MKEKDIEKAILTYLNIQPGCFAFKCNTTGIWDTERKIFRRIKSQHIHKGTSDIIGVFRGRMFAIEVKKPGGPTSTKTYATKEQKIFLENIKANGGLGVVARSIDVSRLLGDMKNADKNL